MLDFTYVYVHMFSCLHDMTSTCKKQFKDSMECTVDCGMLKEGFGFVQKLV